MATFKSGTLSLAYDNITPQGGASGTVLMVHSFATSRAEKLTSGSAGAGAFERKGYRVVARDARGHGESNSHHDPAAYGQGELVGDTCACWTTCSSSAST